MTDNNVQGLTFSNWEQRPSNQDIMRLLAKVDKYSPAEMYESQENIRVAVDFLSRNMAQLPIHVYKRVSDRDRQRDTDSLLAKVLKQPSAKQTQYAFIKSVVSDLALFDEAWIFVTPVNTSFHKTGWTMRPLPVLAIETVSGSEWTGDLVITVKLEGDKRVKIKGENLIHIHGWNPDYSSQGISPIASLKNGLREQIAGQEYRLSTWKNGGQTSAYISRPKDAPDWNDETRQRFAEQLKEYRADGARQGGWPVLEDGMTIESHHLNAKEQQWVESQQLHLETVARVFHINPAMLGSTGGLSYANVKEFNRGLYSETLGPYIVQIEQELNARLPAILGVDDDDLYVEFNVKEKLRGSFEEQAQIYYQAVGGPYMSRNEVRSQNNLPAIDGGDDVLQPLNMTTNARDTPDDSEAVTSATEALSADEIIKLVNAASALIRSGFTPQASLLAVGLDPIEHLGLLPVTVQKPLDEEGNVDEEIEDALKSLQSLESKSTRVEVAIRSLGSIRKKETKKVVSATPHEGEKTLDLIQGVIKKHAQRQRNVVLPQLNTKSEAWWDEERWNKELADDLFEIAVIVTQQIGANTAKELGFDGQYDTELTLKFLRAVAESRAGAINNTTFEQIQDALGSADKKPEDVFDSLANERGDQASNTMHNMFVAWAGTEAVKQIARKVTPIDEAPAPATKTWLVQSNNPRDSHAGMNGETVGIDEPFSNGAMWPGDPVLGADGVSNCKCGVEVSVEVN